MSDTKKYSSAMFEALEVADNITPSVMAVAIASGVKAKVFADMIADEDETSAYRAEVAKHLQDAFVKKAVEKEKKEKAKAEKED